MFTQCLHSTEYHVYTWFTVYRISSLHNVYTLHSTEYHVYTMSTLYRISFLHNVYTLHSTEYHVYTIFATTTLYTLPSTHYTLHSTLYTLLKNYHEKQECSFKRTRYLTVCALLYIKLQGLKTNDISKILQIELICF